MGNSFARDLRRAALPLARLLGSVPGAQALGGANFGRAWGLAPEAMDYHHAFKLIPTIQFCVEMYQTTIAATPLRFYTGQGDTKTELERATGNIVDLWMRGNTEDTGSNLIEQIVGSRQLQGNAYLFKDYMGTSLPRQFWCLNPLTVRPIASKTGRGVVEYEVRDGSTFIRVPKQQIIHFKRYDPDLGLLGVSRVGALKLSYETQRDGARFMRSFYKRGGTVAGHYSTETALDPDEIEALKKDLHERVQGPEHAWEPVILPRKLKFERAGLTFAEMQFIESEKMTTEQMLRVFRLHPILASQNVSAGLNSEVANTAMMMFLRFGAFPEARAIAETLTERLLSTGEFGRNLSCEFDFSNDPVLVDAWLKQAEAWAKATGGFPATRAEARDKLGLPDRTDEFPTLDEPLVPIGLTTEGDFAAGDSSPEPAPKPKPATDDGEDPLDSLAETRGRASRETLRTRNAKLLALHERKVRAETLRLFRRQRARVVSAVKAQAASEGALARAIGAPDTRAYDLDALLTALDEPEDRRRVRRLIRAIVADVGEAALAELAADLSFNLAATAVADFIEEKALKYITNINRTTRAALRASLSEGVSASETLGELVARVDEAFDGRRANSLTIARTETAPAYNFATQEAWKQSGVVTAKQWLSAKDDAVRDSHEGADGQEVPLSASFSVGGESLRYPGDPNGSGENIINCRCTMVPVVHNPDDESGKQMPRRIAERLRPSLNGHARGTSFEEWLHGQARK